MYVGVPTLWPEFRHDSKRTVSVLVPMHTPPAVPVPKKQLPAINDLPAAMYKAYAFVMVILVPAAGAFAM